MRSVQLAPPHDVAEPTAQTSQPCVRLTLLGVPSLSWASDKSRIRLPTRKSIALLAYLALAPQQTASRDEVATLLWGDCSEQHARASLRQALASVRKELGSGEFLAADNRSVRLQTERWSVDILELESLLRSGAPADLARAGPLFGGEFLKGLNVEEEEFENWVKAQRVRTESLAGRLCERWAEQRTLVQDPEQAIATVERLVALDPLREDWQRSALVLFARYRGQREALVLADLFSATLKRELGVEPERATRLLVDQIRSDPLPDQIAPSRSLLLDSALSPAPVADASGKKQIEAASDALMPADDRPAVGRGRWRIPSPAAAVSGAVAAALILVGVLSLAWDNGASGRPPANHSWASLARLSPNERPISLTAIAVLPFSVPSRSTPDFQAVADGMTDDLINRLSRSPSLRVISRQTVINYRQPHTDLAALGAEWNVQFFLEGSLRLEGDLIRVNVSLVDPRTRSPAWSAQIDRSKGEAAAVRDEIVARLSRELTFEIPTLEAATRKGDPTVSRLIYRGWAAIYASGTSTPKLREAEEAFFQALALNPEATSAQIGLGSFHALAAVLYLDGDPAGHLAKAEDVLTPVIARFPGGTSAHFAMALVHQARGDTEKAVQAYERALDFNPSHAPSYGGLGHSLIGLGKVREGLEHVHYALRLSPRDPQRSHWLRFAGEGELELQHYEGALSYLRNADMLNPGQPQTVRSLAAAEALTGKILDARGHIAKLKEANPGLTSDRLLRRPTMLAASQPELLRGLKLALIEK